MAKELKKIFDPSVDEVVQAFTIQSWHVSQSVDALTGDDDYDITISGSLTVTGSIFHDGVQDAGGVAVDTVVRDSSTGELYITSSTGGGVGTYTNANPTPIDFPNGDDPSIPQGSTFSNKTFTEMMDLMLYPTLNPTLTAPSHTLSITPSSLQEIGDTITVSLDATFNQGSISPAYAGGPSVRSGPPVEYRYTGTGTSNTTTTSLTDTKTISSYTVLTGVQSWTCEVSHSAGQQPLDSDGGNFGSPLPHGLTSTITRTITGVYPVFATSVSIGTSTKQSLQLMTTDIEVDVAAETAANLSNGDRQEIDIPAAWNNSNGITGVELFNTLGQSFDFYPIENFTITDVDLTIQGNIVPYKRYTYNGDQAGARTYKFLV